METDRRTTTVGVHSRFRAAFMASAAGSVAQVSELMQQLRKFSVARLHMQQDRIGYNNGVFPWRTAFALAHSCVVFGRAGLSPSITGRAESSIVVR